MKKKIDHVAAARRAYEDALERSINPAPRIGSARPKRASQATKKAPSKRLVARRKANTRPGYFPNPTNPSAVDMNVLDSEIMSSIKGAVNMRTVKERQASASYAQGLIQGLFYANVLDKKQWLHYVDELKKVTG